MFYILIAILIALVIIICMLGHLGSLALIRNEPEPHMSGIRDSLKALEILAQVEAGKQAKEEKNRKLLVRYWHNLENSLWQYADTSSLTWYGFPNDEEPTNFRDDVSRLRKLSMAAIAEDKKKPNMEETLLFNTQEWFDEYIQKCIAEGHPIAHKAIVDTVPVLLKETFGFSPKDHMNH